MWRDPAFIFCFVFSAVLYGAMLPLLWPRATNALYAFLLGAYFFLLWFLICAIVSIPIGTIREYWRGQHESQERQRQGAPANRVQAAARVSGRMFGRLTANKAGQAPGGDGDDGQFE